MADATVRIHLAAGGRASLCGFWQVTGEALLFATTKLKVRLRPDDRTRLMNAYLELKAWPDVRPALESLRASGLKLALLSNLTPTMLGSNIKSAGLDGMFERLLSTDEARTFKPDPRAYQLGVDALKVKREEILFVAFAGWDAVPNCSGIPSTGSIDNALLMKRWALLRMAPARR
jgi:2-haloacid dehalogenase